MKPHILIVVLLIISCKNEPAQTTTDNNSSIKPPEKTTATTVSPWDFNGDGNDDSDISINVVKGEGNPVEEGTPDSYTVVFKNSKLPPLPIGCCEPVTVGEGDLDGDGRAELTILQAPNHGCTYNFTIWSFKSNKWQQVFGPELVPTACEALTHELQELIVKENGTVYFYKADMNDEDFKKVKTEIKLR
jgi:hypothetical protein